MQENQIPLPEQKEGVEKNIESTLKAENIDEAKRLYNLVKQRLLHVNQWHSICGPLSAEFQLTDDKGEHLEGEVNKGNYFKIDIPGPGSASGEGYDWVHVEEIQHSDDPDKDCEYTLIRVRPASNPSTADEDVAHFFSDKATSNFVLKREGNVITTAVYGRNETANTETGNLIDKARNAVVGVGAIAGASSPQWKSLTDGLLNVS